MHIRNRTDKIDLLPDKFIVSQVAPILQDLFLLKHQNENKVCRKEL